MEGGPGRAEPQWELVGLRYWLPALDSALVYEGSLQGSPLSSLGVLGEQASIHPSLMGADSLGWEVAGGALLRYSFFLGDW